MNPSQRAKKQATQTHMDDLSKLYEQRLRETIHWVSVTDALPDADEEVLICYETNDGYDRDVTLGRYDDSMLDEGLSPWIVSSDCHDFGIAMYWAHKPQGPKRS